MKTDLALRFMLSVALLTLLASCAPSTQNDATLFAGNEIESSSIIGGQDATLEYAQENGIVGLYDMAKGGMCTGSLIGQNLILTAAHCVNVEQPSKMLVFFGTDFEKIVEKLKKKDFSDVRIVDKLVRHANYGANKLNPDLSANDIALIHFSGPAAAGFKLAEMASAVQGSALGEGSVLTLAGYGLNEFKRDPETGKPLTSKGSGLLRSVDNIKVAFVDEKQEEILLDQREGRGACHGDSGGPAYVKDTATNKMFVIGVTSRGDGNCDNAAIYTDVVGYATWIADKSKELMQ